MNTSMQINNELNRMVNVVTQQDRVRLEELWRYPLCVVYGSFAETVGQMLRMELTARIGNGQAFELAHAEDKRDMESIERAVNRLRGRMEEGILNLKNKFYVPVIFMADQMEAGEMSAFMKALSRQMVKMGFDVAYEICYYCILDYEKMDGNACKAQLLKLQECEQARYPVGIFTQNHLCLSEYEKYLKVVQAIAMHIFLQVSRSDMDAGVLYDDARTEIPYFTLGYWKLDVLKQKIADYLIWRIGRQSEKLIEYGKYSDKVRILIDQIMKFDMEEWIRAFTQMPVNATALEPYLHPGFLRHPKLRYEELFQLLYGDREVYPKFVRYNIGIGVEQRYIEAFLQEDIGNLYAVKNDLKNVLSDIGKYYTMELEKIAGSKVPYSGVFHFGRNSTVADILPFLRRFWDWDNRILELERKIKFVKVLQEYVGSQGFKEKIRRQEEQNEDEANRLRSIRREASMNEDNIINSLSIDIKLSEKEEIPIWDQDIFDTGILKKIESYLSEIHGQVEAMVNTNVVAVIGDYVTKIRQLKQDNQDALYYAAKVDIPRVTREKEYIFIGRRDSNRRNVVEDIQNVVKIKLPDAEVTERKWETGMCFELFVVKEIVDLAEIYGID